LRSVFCVNTKLLLNEVPFNSRSEIVLRFSELQYIISGGGALYNFVIRKTDPGEEPEKVLIREKRTADQLVGPLIGLGSCLL
jgi:hypothetical protein